LEALKIGEHIVSVVFKEKILVVDDEPDVVRILSKSLMIDGFEVITANDGLECLAKVENEPPDLILLDNIMPNMDGQAVLKKLKASKETEEIPIIMVTALADEKDITSAQKGGAIEYVVKPFDYNVLLKQIKQTLKSKCKSVKPG
jgi:DNA-binding response OmpR family regulator